MNPTNTPKKPFTEGTHAQTREFEEEFLKKRVFGNSFTQNPRDLVGQMAINRSLFLRGGRIVNTVDPDWEDTYHDLPETTPRFKPYEHSLERKMEDEINYKLAKIGIAQNVRIIKGEENKIWMGKHNPNIDNINEDTVLLWLRFRKGQKGLLTRHLLRSELGINILPNSNYANLSAYIETLQEKLNVG